MTIKTIYTKTKGIVFFVFFIVLVMFFLGQKSFGCGMLVSLLNASAYYGFYFYHKRLISRYPMQALVVVASSTVVRFLFIGGLLVLCFHNPNLTAKTLVLGFVLGQLYFLIHHLMVASSNVK